jgi:hypothetical protein
VNEPERLLDRGRDDLATRLLRSAQADQPDRRSTARAFAAVALAASATSATSGAAAGGGVLAGIVKWLGAGMLAGSLVAVSADRLASRDAPTEPASRAPSLATHAPTPIEAETTPSLASAEPATSPRPPERSRAVAPSIPVPAEPSPIEPPHVAPTASFDPAPSPARASLGDEIRALDAARARLAAGDAPGALAGVADYERRFPRGRLSQEAALVRVEALVRSGRCADARAAGAGFLAAHPDSVLAKRTRTLLERCR